MAVYTHVSEAELAVFLRDYKDIVPVDFRPIAAGVQNSNYFLDTKETRYILTLYEDKQNGVQPDDLPFFLQLLQHLDARGFPCPAPCAREDGALFGTLCGRPAALTSFLRGVSSRNPQPVHCGALGQIMARMHNETQGFALTRKNNHALADWQALFDLCQARADDVAPDLAQEIKTTLTRVEKNWRSDLPQGIIHADMFPDNVFFENRALTGVIDFYFACHDLYAYDLAIALNAWCFESDIGFNITKARALMQGYQSERALSADELEALPILAQGAALRFLLTRLYDWLHPSDDALVQPKDPVDYLRRLRFHKNVKSAADYGIESNV